MSFTSNAKFSKVRASRSLPDGGRIKLRTTTLNQDNDPVQIRISNVLVLRRQSQELIN